MVEFVPVFHWHKAQNYVLDCSWPAGYRPAFDVTFELVAKEVFYCSEWSWPLFCRALSQSCIVLRWVACVESSANCLPTSRILRYEYVLIFGLPWLGRVSFPVRFEGNLVHRRRRYWVRVLPLDGHMRHDLLEQRRCVTSGVMSFEYLPPQYSTQTLILSLIDALKSFVSARTTLLNVLGISKSD